MVLSATNAGVHEAPLLAAAERLCAPVGRGLNLLLIGP